MKVFSVFFFLLLTILCTGCQKNEKDEVLKVCVNEEQAMNAQALIEGWVKKNPEQEAELVIIPQDDSLEEAKITEILTEIMSGGGPDVFLINCDSVGTPQKEAPRIFEDPEKSMNTDIFLPLDEYMEKAEYMDTSEWNQVILESGRTEKGQVVLPIRYQYYVCQFPKTDSENTKEFPRSWDELEARKEKFMDLGLNLSTAFPYIFGEVVDYHQKEMILSEEELMKRAEEAFQYTKMTWESEQNIAQGKFYRGIISEHILAGLSADKTSVWRAFPNVNGGVTAIVSMYAAINSNTENPERAFSLLDFLFSEEVMSGRGFKEDEKMVGTGAVFTSIFGITVNDKIFVEQNQGATWLEDILEINSKITDVRYNSGLEWELFNLPNQLYDPGKKDGEMKDSEDREQAVQQTYARMNMILAE
ncbi:extracellular solute-binding protein [Lacrimispora saccharolytica]|nr:extracellular solute-binding protein [Lacrimispora saccharolytica]